MFIIYIIYPSAGRSGQNSSSSLASLASIGQVSWNDIFTSRVSGFFISHLLWEEILVPLLSKIFLTLSSSSSFLSFLATPTDLP